jgi:hypothetical protein
VQADGATTSLLSSPKWRLPTLSGPLSPLDRTAAVEQAPELAVLVQATALGRFDLLTHEHPSGGYAT